MRNLKLTRGIQIILITLLLLIGGIIEVSMSLNNKVSASTICSVCNKGELVFVEKDRFSHGLYCSECNMCYSEEPHDLERVIWGSNVSGIHNCSYQCYTCKMIFNGELKEPEEVEKYIGYTSRWYVSYNCVYLDGECVCGATSSTVCSECNEGTLVVEDIDGVSHGYYCSICDEYYNKSEHVYIDGKCQCGYSPNSGIVPRCSNCNEFALTFGKIDDEYHGYYCSNCGAEFDKTSHTGGHCINNGTCQVCLSVYQTHYAKHKVSTGFGSHYYECVCGKTGFGHCLIPDSGNCFICGQNKEDVKSTGDICEDGEHNYVYIPYDDDSHFYFCNVCGSVPNGCEHEYSEEYTENGDGTHSRKCIDCGYQLTEECTFNGDYLQGNPMSKDGTHYKLCDFCDGVRIRK